MNIYYHVYVLREHVHAPRCVRMDATLKRTCQNVILVLYHNEKQCPTNAAENQSDFLQRNATVHSTLQKLSLGRRCRIGVLEFGGT